LDYRLITGSGLGYQWIDEEHMKFSTDAGLALLKEKYTSRVNDPTDNDEDEDGIFRQIKNVTRSDDLSLQLGYNYFWEPNQNTIVLSNMIYTPAVEDFSDYFLTFDAELRLAITKIFFTVVLDLFWIMIQSQEMIPDLRIQNILSGWGGTLLVRIFEVIFHFHI